nr:MAG TPA: hypothetical protein [Bacteriophage sp.]
MKIAEPYLNDIDFAFFVVNFGYTKADYEALTRREIAFIKKEWENKLISDSYNMYNAMFKASYNVQRPKRKRALKLWQKSRTKKADMEVVKDNLRIVKENEDREGTAWVKQIYKANNLPYKGVKQHG